VNPPNDILLTYNLYPHGTIEIGYESYLGGMSVGMRPLVARIQIPKDCGNYPDGWFPLPQKSLHKIRGEFEKEKLQSSNQHIIPNSILLECFRYHWEVLQRGIEK
jgi:hypothetical protein